MEYVVRICAFTVFFCTVIAQPIDTNKVFIKIINRVGQTEIAPPYHITVLLKQENTKQSESYFAFDKPRKKLFYFLNKGPVTIEIVPGILQNTQQLVSIFSQTYELKDLNGLDLIISGSARKTVASDPQTRKEITVLHYDFNITTQFADNPPKKKIRAYKTTDRNTEWTVIITDKNGIRISPASTFKKNTDRFAKSLYLQLNVAPITNAQDPKIKFNENNIEVFKSKKISSTSDLPTKTITSETIITPSSQIEITDKEIKIVNAPNEPKD